jgi:pimeloyl-ACP methyl ester carboxylesterase
VPNGNRTVLAALDFAMAERMRQPLEGWVLRRGMLVHGVDTMEGFINALQAFTLEGRVDRIACPVLVCASESDAVAGQARQLFDALAGPKQFHLFTDAEGAGEHCAVGGRMRFNAAVFDWLDGVLGL